MIKLQETNAAETRVDPTRINQSEIKAWRQPTLTTWEVPEETQTPLPSGPDAGIK